MPQRNGILTTITVIAIVLGSLGVLSLLLTGGLMLAKDKINEFASAQNAGAGVPQQLQKEMQNEMEEIQDKWRYFTFGSLLLKAGVVALLLLGGFLAFGMSDFGRTLLVLAFIIGIFLEVVSIYPSYAIQQSTVEVVTNYQQKIVAAQNGGVAPPEHIRPDVGTKIGLVVGVVIAIGWMLLKLCFYVFGFIYLGKRNIKKLYAGEIPHDNFPNQMEE